MGQPLSLHTKKLPLDSLMPFLSIQPESVQCILFHFVTFLVQIFKYRVILLYLPPRLLDIHFSRYTRYIHSLNLPMVIPNDRFRIGVFGRTIWVYLIGRCLAEIPLCYPPVISNGRNRRPSAVEMLALEYSRVWKYQNISTLSRKLTNRRIEISSWDEDDRWLFHTSKKLLHIN